VRQVGYLQEWNGDTQSTVHNETNPITIYYVRYKHYCSKTEINREIKRENVKQVSESNTILRLIKYVLLFVIYICTFLSLLIFILLNAFLCLFSSFLQRVVFSCFSY
jgi:small-conductance mechanosensitive channel